MRIIFCADPLMPRAVDEVFAAEAQAAGAAGIACDLINYERLVHDQDAAAAIRRVAPATTPEPAIYRGWMLRTMDYRALYDALMAREHRLFFLDGALLADAPYWEADIDDTVAPPIEHFGQVAARVPSRFFTMDVAQRLDGAWMVVELGDAQVAGLPEKAEVASFYNALAT